MSQEPNRKVSLAGILAAFAVLALALAACGGGDEGGKAAQRNESASEKDITGARITIRPTSGPSGTKIYWIASGPPCSNGATKRLELVELAAMRGVGVPHNVEEALKARRQERKAVVSEDSSTKFRGTITVPKDAAPGNYYVKLRCWLHTAVVTWGNVTIHFEVTGE